MKELRPYNPLDQFNLAKSVVGALLEQEPVPLGNVGSVVGCGIYALYYVGNYGPYEPLVLENERNWFSLPIYVGKADPKGTRKGIRSATSETSKSLSERLKHHGKSIIDAENLRIEDFHCRYLPLEYIWNPLAESLLITQYRPVWNLVVEGFGNKTPGGRRFSQSRSRWDTIHPGREYGAKCMPREEPVDQIFSQINAHFNP